MKTVQKILAAALGGIMTAGMLSALPASAYRRQLGTYRRVGDNGLYLSDSGAIQVDSEDTSGLQFSIRLPAAEEPDFRAHIAQKLRMYVQNAAGDPETRFVFRNEALFTDTRNKGTEEEPVYTYSVTDRQQGHDFYSYASKLYYYLSHSAYAAALQSFRYYPDFGCVNGAGCYGYAVAGKPEMRANIEAWLAEHAPGVVTRMSDDDGILNLGWDETDGDMAYEPYCPYPDMYGIWQAFGYVPAYTSTAMYRHGDEFAVDFMQQQKWYDSIPAAQIQNTLKKYHLDEIGDSPYRLFLIFPDSTVNALAARAGSMYNTVLESAVKRSESEAYMLTEGLNIGFAAGVSLEGDARENGTEIFGTADVQGLSARLYLNMGDDPAGEPDYLLKPQDAAHVLAYLDRYLGLEFGVSIRVPFRTGQQTLRGDLNLDDSADVADAVLLARYCVADREAVITDQGLRNADADGDGLVTAEDIQAILRIIAKKDRPIIGEEESR
ncbi:MAG: dockerin type I repeat-containing protein [Oscillospiraceae bacterium]|nr:dockerin type I repeat-containing protein [Oscillospiraceae bacterium]